MERKGMAGQLRIGAVLFWIALGVGVAASSVPVAAAAMPACVKEELRGQIAAGQEWRAPIGNGWVMRLTPIQGGQAAAYSGWDLVVDRDPPAGFPDALLLGTPPWGSINQREIGTTFGLRAQDALGWNPRSFRFYTNPADLLAGQKLYLALRGSNASPAPTGTAAHRLMTLLESASPGQLRILDARIVPGTADAADFAGSWAVLSARTPHTIDTATNASPSPRGVIEWMRFSVTLWLPADWRAPKGVAATRAACSQ